MKNLSNSFIIIASILLTLISCERLNSDPYESSKKAILGKWEIIELGNWPDMIPCQASGFIEYLPNDIVKIFDYEKNQYLSQRKYWIDSLLHESISVEVGFELTFDYRYKFDDNKLRLDSKSLMIYNTSVYKRLN